MSGPEHTDYHCQDDSKSEAKARRSQDALPENSTQGGTTNTR